MSSQLAITVPASSAATSPNTWGWRRTSLSWIAVGDVGDREPPGLLGDRGVELDLVQHVAELLDQRLVGRRIVGVEGAERVDELERLLDEVRHERGVGLLAVPRALLAQRAGELVEADVAGADGHAERGHVDARQVVGLDGPIELAPRRVR